MEITKNKQREVQLIYSRDVTCNCSIEAVPRTHVTPNKLMHQGSKARNLVLIGSRIQLMS